MKQQLMRVGGFLSTVLLLAGCGGWFGSSKDASCPSCPSSMEEPLICFGSRVVVSFEDFKKKIKMLQEAQPGIEAIIGSMPEAEQLNIYTRFAEGCVATGLSREYVKDKGLANTTEFKEMQRQAHEALDDQLYMQAFQNDVIKELDAVIEKMTEAELRSYYEQNRDKNQAFQREPFIKRRSEKETKAGAKEYAAFEDVRDHVKQSVKQAKLQEFFENKLEELKQKYGVRVEEACLHKLVVKKEEQRTPAPTETQEEGPSAVQSPSATPVKTA